MANRVRYRLRFRKFGRIRFIGHLDLLNVFQRAIKRAKLPIAYSQGFNPHQEMSFALPLSLGYYSDGEYLDLVFTDAIGNEEIITGLNQFLPEGIEVVQARQLEEGEKPAAATVRLAEYMVKTPLTSQINESHILNFFSQPEIKVMKKTKNKTALTDIKPDIFNLAMELTDNGAKRIKMLISAGSEKSVRADVVIGALCEFAKEQYEPYKTSYTRVNLYKDGGVELV